MVVVDRNRRLCFTLGVAGAWCVSSHLSIFAGFIDLFLGSGLSKASRGGYAAPIQLTEFPSYHCQEGLYLFCGYTLVTHVLDVEYLLSMVASET